MLRSVLAVPVRAPSHVAAAAAAAHGAAAAGCSLLGNSHFRGMADAKAGGKGGGGGKKKKDKVIKAKSPDSGRKWGHGADNRPERHVTRATELQARAAAGAKAPAADDGAIFTDDEEMQRLYNLVNSGALEHKRAEVEALKAEGRLATLPDDVEEPEDIGDELSTAQYAPLLTMPDELRGKAQIVDDDLDFLAVTDQDLTDGADEEMEGSDGGAQFAKRRGARPASEAERAPGYGAVAGDQAAWAKWAASTVAPGIPRRKREVDALADVPADDLLDAAGHEWDADEDSTIAPSPLLPGGRAGKSTLRPPASDSEEEGGGAARTLTGASRVILRFGEPSAADEKDAALSEQAAALLSAAGRGSVDSDALRERSRDSAGPASLSGDDSSDWGGDPLDFRFQQSPALQYRAYKARFGARDTDSEVERLLAAGVEEEDLTRISPMFGVGRAGIEAIPSQVIHELARPLDLYDHQEEAPYPPAATVREAAMTPAERVLDEQRKALRNLIERPLPMVNRPLWPTYAMITGADMVTQVMSGGNVQSTRVMIVVGNGMGGAGMGMGKHKEPFMAAKVALSNAHRDMIHVSTHKGQLYHDLIGKKNSVYVIIRTMPSASEGLKGAPLIQDVFEMMGISHASAKIVGSKRRNPYTVTQALFDAFNHHVPPEDEAFKRGLRMQWMGADRTNGRTVFPWIPNGPRYPAANARHQTGMARA